MVSFFLEIDNNLNQSIRVKDHFLGGEKAISSVSRETTEKIRLDKSGKNVHIWNL